ncbi:hypothetical protein VNI00_011183 [Paramarasmius palmivorus]|uniref:Uncharacterized protein n=1 Tax=Paramarasmius palmivorus TaxID=297713 RepID=A0AAW0CEU5_9AGAR
MAADTSLNLRNRSIPRPGSDSRPRAGAASRRSQIPLNNENQLEETRADDITALEHQIIDYSGGAVTSSSQDPVTSSPLSSPPASPPQLTAPEPEADVLQPTDIISNPTNADLSLSTSNLIGAFHSSSSEHTPTDTTINAASPMGSGVDRTPRSELRESEMHVTRTSGSSRTIPAPTPEWLLHFVSHVSSMNDPFTSTLSPIPREPDQQHPLLQDPVVVDAEVPLVITDYLRRRFRNHAEEILAFREHPSQRQ